MMILSVHQSVHDRHQKRFLRHFFEGVTLEFQTDDHQEVDSIVFFCELESQ